MFKKIITAGTVALFFACSSSDDNTNNGDNIGGNNLSSSVKQNGSGDSSSSDISGDDSSSSTANEPSTATVIIAKLNSSGQSDMLKTYHYAYTLKAGKQEDLAPFWNVADTDNCPTTMQDKKPPTSCQLEKTGAILQNTITNQYSDLHYEVPLTRVNSLNQSITLKQWNLTGNGDEAALGLNVYTDEANIQNMGDRGITALDKIVAFKYKRAGGAHEFRLVSKDESDFWYYEVPATADPIVFGQQPVAEYETITIPVNELKGMGSYAANNEEEEAPFDISKVAKFLWAVKYNAENEENNKGSLVLYSLEADVMP